MKPTPVKIKGTGRDLLLIHGSGADHRTWSLQLATLAAHFRVIAYDRHDIAGLRDSLADQADDAAEILASHASAPALVCGSSFGGVIALELCRRRPDLVLGMIACEPPISPSDAIAPAPIGFGCHFEGVRLLSSGERAAEMFLRAVLGSPAFDAMSPAWQRLTCEKWREIRADITALSGYSPGYHRLAEIATPALLVTGEKSPPIYRLTMEVLTAALANAEMKVIAGAGHMMHAEAHRTFNRAVRAFSERL
ncbi:MAG TPA: alpha/beta hydrolase [Kofleriaceae bacterium]|nr:alpha/beta hydrolase [Kofleriaceae bacterium]